MCAVTVEIGLPSGTGCRSIGAVAAENSRPPIRRFCHKIPPHLSTARTSRAVMGKCRIKCQHSDIKSFEIKILIILFILFYLFKTKGQNRPLTCK